MFAVNVTRIFDELDPGEIFNLAKEHHIPGETAGGIVLDLEENRFIGRSFKDGEKVDAFKPVVEVFRISKEITAPVSDEDMQRLREELEAKWEDPLETVKDAIYEKFYALDPSDVADTAWLGWAGGAMGADGSACFNCELGYLFWTRGTRYPLFPCVELIRIDSSADFGSQDDGSEGLCGVSFFEVMKLRSLPDQYSFFGLEYNGQKEEEAAQELYKEFRYLGFEEQVEFLGGDYKKLTEEFEKALIAVYYDESERDAASTRVNWALSKLDDDDFRERNPFAYYREDDIDEDEDDFE